MIIIASYSNVSVTYTADGTQTVFSFPFDYLRKAFVKVEVAGDPLEQGTDFSVSGKTVVFQTAPAVGLKVRIFRETETIPLVSWADASVLKAKDMTIQQVQVLHILEEYKGQYNEDLANMLIIAGVVTDSGELQHIVDQLNLIDANAAAALDSENSAIASATAAANSATEATTAETALINFLETKETLTAPAVDTTLTVTGAAADAKVTGDTIKSTQAEMSMFGVDDLLWSGANFYDGNSRTASGVTYTVDNANETISVAGTATGNTGFYRLFYTSTDAVIPTLQIGKEYIARINNPKVKLQIYSTKAGGTSTLVVDTYTTQKFTLPADCAKTNVRVFVANGDTANTTVRPSISEAPTLYELNNRIETDVMKKLDGVTVPANTDLNTLKDTGFAYLSTNYSYVNYPLADDQQGIIRIYNTGSMVTQFVNGTKIPDQYVRRYYYGTDAWSDWVSDFTDVTKLDKTEASLFGVQDVLWSGADWHDGTTYTKNDVTFTTNKDNRTISVVGTASAANTFYRIFYDGSTVMPTLVKGKKYIAHINAENVYLRVYYNNGNDSYLLANTNTMQEFTIPNDAIRTTIRLDVLNGVTVNEVVRPFISEAMSLQELTESVSTKSLKILFLGHSTMQDELTYVPWILQNVAPELKLTMGIGYKSGVEASGVNGLVAGFDDPSYTFDIYSVYTPGASAWVNQNSSVTIKQALDDQEWDVVVPLESILSTGGKIPSDDTTHFASLGTLIDQIISYLGRPIKIGAFFNHNRYATNSNVPLETAATYTDGIEQYKTYVWEAYASQFIFPNFTAYWNARGTTLDQYGDAEWHHMLADYAHYQEGIGCYLGSCSSALTILDIAGITDKSILGEQTRPDLQWVTDHNIPGKNPGAGTTVVGITDANCLIAQKCAIMAHKFPWNISTIV